MILLFWGIQYIFFTLQGLKFLFVPKWHEILNVQVWRKAAEQMFFSLSVSWGGLIMFGSYNKFRNKVTLILLCQCLSWIYYALLVLNWLSSVCALCISLIVQLTNLSWQVHIDALIVSSLDFITSLIASAAVFSVLGAMAKDLQIDIKQVAKSGECGHLVVFRLYFFHRLISDLFKHHSVKKISVERIIA